MAIGAASGAAGYGAGQLVSGALVTSSTLGGSILNGAITGASGGFAGGFVGGAANALAGGASLRDGFRVGLRAGGYGAITGGVIGGISGGLQYSKQIGTFRKGLSKLGVQSGEPVSATDNFLMQSQETWYPDAPMECVSKFTVENVPANHQVVLDANGAAARTVPLKRGGMLTGNSNVYFNKNLAFTSPKRLFFTMGHEFVHVSQYSSLAGQARTILTEGFVNLMEFHAYSYESNMLGSSNYGGVPSQVSDLVRQYSSTIYMNSLHYNNFSWIKTVQF